MVNPSINGPARSALLAFLLLACITIATSCPFLEARGISASESSQYENPHETLGESLTATSTGRQLAATRPPPPRRRPPPPRRRPPPPKPSSAFSPGAACSLVVNSVTTQYSKCYATTDAQEPMKLYFRPTATTMKIAISSKPGSTNRWLGFLFLGPFGGMFEADGVLGFPCGGLKDTSKICGQALNMGNSYTPPGFTPALKNITLVGNPKASRLKNGANVIQFEIKWNFGASVQASYISGPLAPFGIGYSALSEHEIEETPIIKISKSGAMSCVQHCVKKTSG